MAASFSVTRRFFDDKNYPRGFSRHGDYTIKESQVLEQYGQAFKALDSANASQRQKKKKNLLLFAVVNVHRKLSSKKPGINIVLALTQQNVFTPYQEM